MKAINVEAKEIITQKETTSDRVRIRYPDLFWLFMIGSVIGFILEGIWYMLYNGVWEDHVATVWGPFCIVYGFGAVLMYALSSVLNDQSIGVQFLAYALFGAALEYFSSLFQELFFGSVSWDYSDHFLNLGGRISLQMTLLWGILGVTFARLIFPHLSRLLKKLSGRQWRLLRIALSVFMAIDLTVTACAIHRWGEREEEIPASNAVEAFLDQTYDDAVMEKIFPNMEFRDWQS